MCKSDIVLFCILIITSFYLVIFLLIWLRFKFHKRHDWRTYIPMYEDFKNNTIHQCCRICGKCRHIKKVKQ